MSFLRNSSGHPVEEVMRTEEYSSTGVLKELCMGNRLQEDVLRNSRIIPQVVDSL